MAKNTFKEISYWDNFYKKDMSDNTFNIPSQFCCLVATDIEKNTAILEFGCGNGRDSLFLARHNFNVIATDLSSEAIKTNAEKSKLMDNITFICGDCTDKSNVNNALSKTRNISQHENIIVYSRFFLHTLDENQESKFIKILSKSLNNGDKLYFEFRTNKDENSEKIYTKHFRRFVVLKDFMKMLEKCNFHIEYHIEGKGMAKFQSEDAFVGRVIAIKK